MASKGAQVKTFAHQRPVRDGSGELTGYRPGPVFRVTDSALGGCFCRDRARRLVVGLEAGDIISFRPEGTRQRITAPAAELYRAALQWLANRATLERARGRKAMLAARRLRRNLAAAERRLTR